jgi:hypothetical protein
MKSLLIIPLITLPVLAAVAAGLSAMGVRVMAADPLCAGIVAAGSGMIAMAPMLIGRPPDQALGFQLALFGTVLQMLLCMAIGVTIIATNAVPHDGRLGFWLIGGYWVSLFVTIAELRRLVLAAPLAKAEK